MIGAVPRTGPSSADLVASREPAWRSAWRVLKANPLTLTGAILVALIVLAAIVIGLVPLATGLVGAPVSVLPYSPNAQNLGDRFAGPSLPHPFGTDELGRDMFSRTLGALPLDLGIGLAVTLFAIVVGGGLGLVSGYWNDSPLGRVGAAVILRVTDVFLAFPSLVLALAIAASLGRGLFTSMLAVMITWWPYYVRLIRGEVLVVKTQPYITAARVAGVPEGRIVLRHVLRNVLDPLMVYFTLDIGTVLITYSTIAFVSTPVPDTTPEWGSMVFRYQDFLIHAPWTVLAPALAILVTVLAFSLLGDGIRDLLDPRSLRVAPR